MIFLVAVTLVVLGALGAFYLYQKHHERIEKLKNSDQLQRIRRNLSELDIENSNKAKQLRELRDEKSKLNIQIKEANEAITEKDNFIKQYCKEIQQLNNVVQTVTNEKNTLDSQLELEKESNQQLTMQVRSLEKYQSILDIEEHIEKLKEKAEREILKAKDNMREMEEISKQYIKSEKDQARVKMANERLEWDAQIDAEKERFKNYKQSLIDQGEEFLEKIKEKINKTEKFLENHEKKILKEAEHQAKEILQDAYFAYQNKESLDSLAKALENKIKGYGDEFLIPNQTILDDLIEEYNHVDAAQHLKKVKEEIKQAVKNSVAADCDYVEESRKNTAIQFITNAFNGKADVYVSRLRYNNVGKLIQSLKDDYLMLNDYGQAFRNVRINPTYLALRVEELKWGALVLEFKEQEKEEQREIREQIKEEEKARREYEKAIKDAEKEEALLRKAYEKARKEFDQASDTQKAQFDEKMKNLMQQLQEAEEKNQRALSMAQQTRAGHVYVISNIGSFGENVLKLGMTRRLDPSERIRELSGASVPFTFDVHAMIYSDDAPGLENQLHKRFSHQRVNKVNYRKEFFEVPLSDVKEYLQEIGVQAHFTLKAEALQYRESIKIKTLPEDKQHELEEHLEQESEQLATVEED